MLVSRIGRDRSVPYAMWFGQLRMVLSLWMSFAGRSVCRSGSDSNLQSVLDWLLMQTSKARDTSSKPSYEVVCSKLATALRVIAMGCALRKSRERKPKTVQTTIILHFPQRFNSWTAEDKAAKYCPGKRPNVDTAMPLSSLRSRHYCTPMTELTERFLAILLKRALVPARAQACNCAIASLSAL